MTCAFTVDNFSHLSPGWWLNFLRSLPLTKSPDDYIKLINSELKNWRAIYVTELTVTPKVIFEEEKYATMFLLRWS